MFQRGVDVGDDHVAQGAHEMFNQEFGFMMVSGCKTLVDAKLFAKGLQDAR